MKCSAHSRHLDLGQICLIWSLRRQLNGRGRLTWVKGDDHVWQLDSQAHPLYERVVCGYEASALCPVTKVHLVLIYDHLHYNKAIRVPFCFSA